MITDAAVLAPRFEALLGSEFVIAAGPSRWAVDGVVPRLAVRPADTEQIGAVLRLCGELGASVVPWGGGTAIEVGNLPRAADVILLTDRLARVVEHDHSNLTVTTQAGITLDALARALAAHRQFLPLEPPRAEAATPGGTVAANLNGPRRMLYGGVRDLVIGVRAVQANGVAIKWGGKTVKNVAGYDMCKLFVGSMGTLGVLTELTFKVFPNPETSRTLALWGGTLAAAAVLAAKVLGSSLIPAAVAILNAGAAASLGRGNPPGASPGRLTVGLLVRAEGFEAAVARHERDIQAWAAQAGMEVETLSGNAEDAAWRAVRDFGWDGDTIAVRLSTPVAALPAVLERLETLLPTTAGLVAHAGSGTIWMRLNAADLPPDLLPALRDLAPRHAGHLLLARAPRDLKDQGDVWTPVPQALPVMRAVKQAFDPRGILSPGRFVAGL